MAGRLGSQERRSRDHEQCKLALRSAEFAITSALRQPTPPADPPSVTALPATPRETLDVIRMAYTFVDASDERVALGILSQRPDIASVLLEALPQVAAIFGEDAPVVLMTIDEHNREPLRLSACVQTTEPVPAAQEKLIALYRAWWNGVSGDIDEALSFGLTWPRVL